MEVKDRVFILKKTRYGESDLILNCMTPHGAKLNLFARSALKSKKRFGGGVLEPTHFIHVLYQDKSGSSSVDQPLHTLKEASLIQGFPGLRSDYARLELAFHVVQMVSAVVRAGEIDSGDLFNLLGNTLKAAETSRDLPLLRLLFEAKLLAQQGVLALEMGEEALSRSSLAEHESLDLEPEILRALRVRLSQGLREYIGVSK